MNHLMIFAVFMVLCLHFESLSSHFHTRNFSDFQQFFVQSFKLKLLKELGLSSAPNVSASKAPKIPAIYKHLVEAQNLKFHQPKEEEEDDFNAKTKRIFLFPDQVTAVTDIAGKNYAFKSNSVDSNLEIKSATLWFHITETPKSAGSVVHEPHVFSLYKAFKTQAPGKVVHTREPFHSQPLKNTGWYSVQTSAVVREWLSMFSKLDMSLGVAIRGPKSLEIGGVNDEAAKQWRFFLVVDTKEKKQLNRKRRKAASKKGSDCKTTQRRECCRDNLEVNFNEIGYTFVIFPKSVNIHACRGSCESHESHVDSFLARSTTFRRLNRENTTCCRPSKMAPLSIIFLDDYLRVVDKTIQNIRVLSCGCVI